jgi:hypothetical protein
LVEALVKGASGADALPLLAFTLQRLFLDYGPEQMLTKAHYDAMGGIEGSVDRKLAEAKTKAGTAGTDANLRRLIVPALATWDTAANAAKRLVPNEKDIIAGDRVGLAPLANALVEARLLTRGARPRSGRTAGETSKASCDAVSGCRQRWGSRPARTSSRHWRRLRNT